MQNVWEKNKIFGKTKIKNMGKSKTYVWDNKNK